MSEPSSSLRLNTIRLPYSNECLASTSIPGIDYAKNPALAPQGGAAQVAPATDQDCCE